MNFNSYKNKRTAGIGGGLGRDKESPLPSLAPIGAKATTNPPPPITKVAPPAQRSILGNSAAYVGADEAFECSEEDELESSEEVKKAPQIDFRNFDYKK